jgi:hypothetical protein
VHTVRVFVLDQALVTALSDAQRAWARRWYVPTAVKVWDALVEELQLENVVSSHSKRYWTEWPWLHVALPVE